MRITSDTNVLLRAIVRDDAAQGRLAEKALSDAESIFVPLPVLCELAWVLRSRYRYNRIEIVDAIRTLVEGETVVADEVATRSGLAALLAGCDFADGVIAHLGAKSGGETFVTFDETASVVLNEQGFATTLL